MAAKAKPKTKSKPQKPTVEQFTKYQAAYDYFNKALFGGQLAPCLLVFRDGKKKRNSLVMGHFAPLRWGNTEGELIHEISINPETLRLPLEETMGTLVHEMCHQWQQDHGKPPRSGYHDRQWGAKMIEVGLVPSDTSRPEGKMTGQRMSHYTQEGGRFATALAKMPSSIALPWVSGHVTSMGGGEAVEKKEKAKNKIKYTCPSCDANIWGKPDLNVYCGECQEAFEVA